MLIIFKMDFVWNWSLKNKKNSREYELCCLPALPKSLLMAQFDRLPYPYTLEENWSLKKVIHMYTQENRNSEKTVFNLLVESLFI